jgi:RNA polymerase sigma-70 factor (ECF subfamily)
MERAKFGDILQRDMLRTVMASLPAETAALTDAQLVGALRNRDDAAFKTLLERYHASLLQLAQSFGRDPSVADDVVRATWLDVLGRLGDFDGRSKLSVWLIGIVIEHSRARSAVSDEPAEAELAPAVEPSRFRGPDDEYHGGWRTFPASWGEAADQRLRSPEAQAWTRRAIDSLPPVQRRVVLLRDVHGCIAAEVSVLLGMTEPKQRALLHRARSSVREALASFMTGR